MTRPSIAQTLPYCQEMLREYQKLADEAVCGPERKHAMLRVYQYRHRIALLKAGTSLDLIRNLEGDCPIKRGHLDADGNLI